MDNDDCRQYIESYMRPWAHLFLMDYKKEKTYECT